MSETIAKILSEPQRREFQIARTAIDAEKRTVELSFASETPVERAFGNEILDCSEKACDLSRLRSSGPLLVNHDPNDQVGVVDSCGMSESKGRAVVRFSKSARAQEIFQDVQDGIRTLVSVGYRVRKVEPMKRDGGPEAYRVTDWEPLEISIVSIPADTSVGVGRSQLISLKSMETQTPQAPPAPAPAPVNVVEVEQRGATAERNKINAAVSILTKYEARELIPQAIEKGWGESEARQAVLDKREQRNPAKPLGESESTPEIGLTGKDLSRYSIVKAIRESAFGGLTGLEKECNDEARKKYKREMTDNGFIIPHDVVATGNRALSAGSNTAGGFTVGTSLLSGSFIELLRNKTFLDKTGAQTLGGLVGNLAIPKQSGGATAYWLSETGSVPASDQSFGQLVATPNRLVADTLFSKELVMQSSLDIEGLVRNDIARQMAIEKDRAALHGLGAAGEPLGIFNASGLATSVTFGAAATWAKILEFETNLATGNADEGSMAFVTSPGSRAKWKAIARFSSTATPLWMDDNTVNGYKALATNQISGNKVVFGNWADLVVFEWAGIDVVVDPYSAKKTGQIEVTVTLWTDLGIRHGASFCISTDSGAQ
jgi:HK97 family phage major capsid protein/HK97 family phage prohead protease